MKKFAFLFLVFAVLVFCHGKTNVFAQKKASAKTNQTKSKTASAPQQNQPAVTVTQIDFEGLKAVLKRNAENPRPLLVNFWATWCEPCREEFPELVVIDAEFRPRGLDFITISLDDLAEIKREVPQFLSQMKATMPAYLLKTADEDTAISYVTPEYRGGLPMTVLFDATGKLAYSRMGIVKPEILRTEIEKLIHNQSPKAASNANQKTSNDSLVDRINNLPVSGAFELGQREALKDIATGKLMVIVLGTPPPNEIDVAYTLMEDYKINYYTFGCEATDAARLYTQGYNGIVTDEVKRRFGDDVIEKPKKAPRLSFPLNKET